MKEKKKDFGFSSTTACNRIKRATAVAIHLVDIAQKEEEEEEEEEEG